ncbi:Dynactin subunit 2 [Cladochytrium tenue]|nr:Dynactin subunit 2 [Cladochytrium tenue]
MLPVVTEKETRVQRLRRLIFEVQELGEELEQAKSSEEAQAAAVEAEKKEGGDAGSGDEGGEGSGAAGEGANGKRQPRRWKGNPLILPGQLLKHVSALQGELGRLSSLAEARPDPALLSIGGVAAGTLAKQAEVGKSLLAQLEAFKAMSISEGGEIVAGLPAGQSDQLVVPSGGGNVPLGTAGVTYELYYAPETAKMTELAKMHELETRVSQLERLIGTHLLQGLDQTDEDAIPAILANAGGTLLNALERLDHHLVLLSQPRQLDGLARRLKVVLVDMERLIELRKKQQLENLSYSRSMAGYISGASLAAGAGDVGGPVGGGVGGPLAGLGAASSAVSDIDMHAAQTETERKVNFLYSALERLDPVIGVLPQLIARLHALRGLHTEAAVFAESLRMVSEEQVMVRETGRGIEEALARVEAGLRENAATAERNVKGLDERVRALMEKLSERAAADAE